MMMRGANLLERGVPDTNTVEQGVVHVQEGLVQKWG